MSLQRPQTCERIQGVSKQRFRSFRMSTHIKMSADISGGIDKMASVVEGIVRGEDIVT